MKIKILQKSFGKNRQDSFWYDGQIATGKVGKATLSLETAGTIRVMFEENGELYRDTQAVKEALDRNLTDKNLKEIIVFDGWSNSNWFQIYSDTTGIAINNDVASSYDEAIEMLKEAVK